MCRTSSVSIALVREILARHKQELIRELQCDDVEFSIDWPGYMIELMEGDTDESLSDEAEDAISNLPTG
jgi:hypothetical protein